MGGRGGRGVYPLWTGRGFGNITIIYLLLGVDKARGRCYTMPHVNGILNIYFCVRGGGTLRARICAQNFGNITKEIV